MEITYHINFWDLSWFQFYELTRNRICQFCGGLCLLLIGFTSFIFARYMDESLQFKVIAFFVVFISAIGSVLAVTVILLFLFVAFWYLLSRLKPGPCKVLATRNNLSVSYAGSRLEWTWLKIKKLQQTQNFILIYVSSLRALVIPKKAFATPAAADNFFTYVSDLLMKARVDGGKVI